MKFLSKLSWLWLPYFISIHHTASFSVADIRRHSAERWSLQPKTRQFDLKATESKKETELSIDDIAKELREKKAAFDERMAQVKSVADAEAVRREYLGRKGPITQAMNYMRDLKAEDKPKLGIVVNKIKDELEAIIVDRLEALKVEEIMRQMEKDRIDVTKPGLGRSAGIGRRHPLSMTMEKALDIFVALGYDTVTSVEDSPEIESDYYCFEALNCPKDHPARDMQDTFYLTEDREYLLRTHTSSVQIRQLEKRKPPLRIVAPGRVYRKDDIDATHSLMFHQVEILALEKCGELTLGHLKGTVEYFLKNMFGPSIQLRFRGSYFPFTEPSMEVDVFFRGRWLEVLGCGMVDPNVLEMAGVDPNEYSGFAAGFGVERFAMVMHGINDLREFTKNDKRFLHQFPHHYDDGVSMFLSGAERVEEEPDFRGTEVPSPFVESLDELKTRHKAAAKEEVQSMQIESSPAAGDEIDVSKLDIRVGVIQKAWEHEESTKLFCEEIDIGEESPRSIASGLREYYHVEDLEGQRVLVLANLKARKLAGFPSHGMVLCASDGKGQVKFVHPPPTAQIGERVFVEGFRGQPATENQLIKKKMLEAILPDLKTNADGVATYKGVPLNTSGGPCLPSLPNADVA